jgi:hypothetical protein
VPQNDANFGIGTLAPIVRMNPMPFHHDCRRS